MPNLFCMKKQPVIHQKLCEYQSFPFLQCRKTFCIHSVDTPRFYFNIMSYMFSLLKKIFIIVIISKGTAKVVKNFFYFAIKK